MYHLWYIFAIGAAHRSSPERLSMRLTDAHSPESPEEKSPGLITYLEVRPMESVIQLITQVGFPIAMCVAVWWDSRKREDQLVTIIKENTVAMSAQTAALDKLADAIKNKEV